MTIQSLEFGLRNCPACLLAYTVTFFTITWVVYQSLQIAKVRQRMLQVT